jgi:Ca2+-binding EF-hand superfamily protein
LFWVLSLIGFCKFDVNLSGEISKLEFLTGIESLGIEENVRKIEVLWGLAMKDEKIEMNYPTFLTLFIESGVLQLQLEESPESQLLKKFSSLIIKHRKSLEEIFNSFDLKKDGNVKKEHFISGCIKLQLQMKRDEYSFIFEEICKESLKKNKESLYSPKESKIKEIKDLKEEKKESFSYKDFVDLIEKYTDSDYVTKLFLILLSLTKKRQLDWKKKFGRAKQTIKKKSTAEDALTPQYVILID